jgi:hypothetical protein
MKTDKQKLFEAFEKVCKIKLIKEEKSPKETLKDHLIELIDLDSYGDLPYVNQYVKGEEKIVELFKIYKKERGYEINGGMSLKKSLIDWLKGMPNVIDGIPTYYNEIRNLLYAIGYIDSNDYPDNPEEQDHIDIEVDKIFFNELANIILEVVRNR